MRLGGEDQVDVGLAEYVVLHALEEKADGCGVRDVEGCFQKRFASTAGGGATDASTATGDDKT